MNNLAQVMAGVLFVSSAVIAFLISQPDVTFSPGIRLILGVANVAVTAMALYLKVQLPGQSRPT